MKVVEAYKCENCGALFEYAASVWKCKTCNKERCNICGYDNSYYCCENCHTNRNKSK